jgi:hypothetical protein
MPEVGLKASGKSFYRSEERDTGYSLHLILRSFGLVA